MQIVYLGIVFAVIIILLAFKRPLYQAILGGLLATILFYRIPPMEIANRTFQVLTTWSSFSVLLSLYLITFLQRILESRGQIRLAQQNLNAVFHNRRVNIIGACLFIGLLPSAASMILCSDIVKEATDGYLKPKEQAFVSSWFRHIPESALPTYTAVLLMSNLSGVPIGKFMVGMLVPVIMLGMIGYVLYLRKIPAALEDPVQEFENQNMEKRNKWRESVSLFSHLWSLLLILILILICGMQVVTAVLISILLSIAVYRVTAAELRQFCVSAFEKKMLGNTFLVLVLKEFLSYTGVLLLLPDAMAALPLPTYLIFALLFFVATVVSGSTAAIAMGTPLAFSSIPGGAPLMVYLMCVAHAASQISPTHVCLVVASDYFHVTLGNLVKKTLPASIAFVLFMTIYYNVLSLIL